MLRIIYSKALVKTCKLTDPGGYCSSSGLRCWRVRVKVHSDGEKTYLYFLDAPGSRRYLKPHGYI